MNLHPEIRQKSGNQGLGLTLQLRFRRHPVQIAEQHVSSLRQKDRIQHRSAVENFRIADRINQALCRIVTFPDILRRRFRPEEEILIGHSRKLREKSNADCTSLPLGLLHRTRSHTERRTRILNKNRSSKRLQFRNL